MDAAIAALAHTPVERVLLHLASEGFPPDLLIDEFVELESAVAFAAIRLNDPQDLRTRDMSVEHCLDRVRECLDAVAVLRG